MELSCKLLFMPWGSNAYLHPEGKTFWMEDFSVSSENGKIDLFGEVIALLTGEMFGKGAVLKRASDCKMGILREDFLKNLW